MKKKLIVTSIIVLGLAAITGLISAFLTDIKEHGTEIAVGDVEVEVIVYFEKLNENNELITYTDNLDYEAVVGENDSFTKFGVCKVNISDDNDIQFIENFRVDVKIYSDVPTYIRVAPIEQLTLTYEVNGVTREVATTQKEYMKFNYDPDHKFFDNRTADGFFYSMEPVIRSGESTPSVISLIGDYFTGQSFNVYERQYSLQIGFIIEAVQAYQGPQRVWQLSTTPWGTDWEVN